MNLERVADLLLSAIRHARFATQRTRRQLQACVALFLALVAIERAAS